MCGEGLAGVVWVAVAGEKFGSPFPRIQEQHIYLSLRVPPSASAAGARPMTSAGLGGEKTHRETSVTDGKNGGWGVSTAHRQNSGLRAPHV